MPAGGDREREEGGLSNHSCQFRLGFAEFPFNRKKSLLTSLQQFSIVI